MPHSQEIDADDVLQVRGLNVVFNQQQQAFSAVRDLSFTLRRGETLAIVGESGSGKSVTSLALMRLLDQAVSEVRSDALLLRRRSRQVIELSEQSETEMRGVRGADMAMIFQEPMTSFCPVYTIGNQIIEAIRLHTSIPKSEWKNTAIELLRKVKIAKPEQRVDEYPYQLSGGMRQRAMIAMALASNPRLLVADEPTTSLDVTVQAQILDLMKDLQNEYGMSILMINHNFGIIAETCDDVAVMYLGRIVENAPTAELLKNPLHPYTQDLFRSIPQVTDKRGQKLAYIEGSVPDAYLLPKGCAFFSRCRKAQKGLCDQSVPPTTDVGNGHLVSCFRYDK